MYYTKVAGNGLHACTPIDLYFHPILIDAKKVVLKLMNSQALMNKWWPSFWNPTLPKHIVLPVKNGLNLALISVTRSITNPFRLGATHLLVAMQAEFWYVVLSAHYGATIYTYSSWMAKASLWEQSANCPRTQQNDATFHHNCRYTCTLVCWILHAVELAWWTTRVKCSFTFLWIHCNIILINLLYISCDALILMSSQNTVRLTSLTWTYLCISFSSVFSQSRVTLFLRCSHSMEPWALNEKKGILTPPPWGINIF